MRVRKNVVLLFSKPPVAGLVKTRLTTLKDGVFAPEVASALYHCMLFDVVEICCAALAQLEEKAARTSAALAAAGAAAADAEGAPAALAGKPVSAASGDAGLAGAGAEPVRDEYELVISTTPASNVEVMRKLFEDAGTWPRELVFIADEGASFDEHYNHAFAQAWERGADVVLSMGADMPALTVPDVDTMADLMHNITLVEALNYCAAFDGNTPPWRTADALAQMGWSEVRVPPNDLHDPRDQIDV